MKLFGRDGEAEMTHHYVGELVDIDLLKKRIDANTMNAS